MSDVIVEDITGDADSDVIISMPIVDGLNWYKTSNGVITGTNQVARPTQFRKTGAGTLELAYGYSTFTGNVEVSQGVLLLNSGKSVENPVNSALGNPMLQRSVTVYNGAEICFGKHDILGQLATQVAMEMVISNATLRLADNSANVFGPVKFYNGDFSYNGGISATRLWGTAAFAGRVTLDGTQPYDWPEIGSNNRFSLGFADDFWIEDLGNNTSNYHGKTTFMVHDVTGSPAVDATIGVPIQDMPDWNITVIFKDIFFKCGLIKAGAGTLCLGGINTYSDGTHIVDGTLLIDGSLADSPVTVESGGRLGGTGSINHVTIENGGGFEVTANQSKSLEINTLVAGQGGVVFVRNPEGIEPQSLRIPFARVTNLNSNFNSSDWSVMLEGTTTTPHLNVVKRNNTLIAGWYPTGTAILLK